MFGLHMPELLVILVIIVLLFGAGKLPEIGSGIVQCPTILALLVLLLLLVFSFSFPFYNPFIVMCVLQIYNCFSIMQLFY